MKFLILLILITQTSQVYSQVFKCKSASGDIAYQNSPCSSSKEQKKIVIKKFDPEQIINAQNKLKMELLQRQQVDLTRKKQALKAQKIKALNAQAESTQALIDAIHQNSDALNGDHLIDYYRYPRVIPYSYKRKPSLPQSTDTGRSTFNPPHIRSNQSSQSH